MRRQQKYPDTATFHFYNANPKNRVTGDCTFRAIATVLEQSWEQTVMEMAELSCKTGYAINDKKGIEKYLESKGWVKQKQPQKDDGTKYTGCEFCEQLQEDPWLFTGKEYDYNARIVAMIGGHHVTAIVSGQILDIWNCSGKTIGNYWTKG